MRTRSSREAVTFPKPLFIDELGRELPAGRYDVVTEEELVEGLSFLAYRVVSTSIAIPPPVPGVPHTPIFVRIDPALVRELRRVGTHLDTDVPR